MYAIYSPFLKQKTSYINILAIVVPIKTKRYVAKFMHLLRTNI